MTDKERVFHNMGMALLSTQRVEYVTTQLLKYLAEYDQQFYGITTKEFLENSKKGIKDRMMLGEVLRLLKLNPKLIVEDDLNDYLRMRNTFIHNFFIEYLQTYSSEQVERAVMFCRELGIRAQNLESFFKGFLYFLMLRHVKDRDSMFPEFKPWDKDFIYFMEQLQNKRLKQPH